MYLTSWNKGTMSELVQGHNPEIMQELIDKEVALGHMQGPFDE